jgi:CRP-like cAMP-binding protein
MSATFQAIDQQSVLSPYTPTHGVETSAAHAAVPERLEREAVTVSADRNEEIFAEGASAQYCYLIVGGCVRTFKLVENGRHDVVEFLLPGDLFGWEALGEYDFSAEAVTPVILWRFSRGSIENFAEVDPDFAHRLLDLAAGKSRVARERMVLLGRKTATERIAAFLLEMAGRVGTNDRAQD